VTDHVTPAEAREILHPSAEPTYGPGDVVNGHRLTEAGQWVPADQKPGRALPWQPIAFGACALMALGSLLPWAQVRTVFGTIGLSGIEGDGVFVLGAALVAAVLVFFRLNVWAALVGLVGLGVSGLAIANVSSAVSDINSGAVANAGIGVGLVISAAASLVLVAACVFRPTQR